MSYSLLSIAYRIFPFLPGAYGLAAYLASRPSSRRGLWTLGLLIAGSLTTFTTAATIQTGLPPLRLLAVWAAVFALPMIVALATVDGLRRARRPRWVGVLAIVATCAAAQIAVSYLPFFFFDLVQAVA